jgi:mannose-6-phosphate isomerase
MPRLNLTTPLTFEPIFMERIWGGRRLQTEFGRNLPRHGRIGESWEIVDREEAQSVVRDGPWRGKTLHELWTEHRQDIFGNVPDSARFPLLVKLLDAQEKLSLQVHPPKKAAMLLGGEPKTEFWYVAAADPNAELFVGLRAPITREVFKDALEQGRIAELVHTIRVKTGDAMFLPAGRFHAVGAGNLLVEIQKKSDTTYRVFDWNRVDEHGKPRTLHVDQAIDSINFDDCKPELARTDGELLVRHELFEIRKWNLTTSRAIAPRGEFAIISCLTGSVRCAGVDLAAGEFFLVPAQLQDRNIAPIQGAASLLRVTIPR